MTPPPFVEQSYEACGPRRRPQRRQPSNCSWTDAPGGSASTGAAGVDCAGAGPHGQACAQFLQAHLFADAGNVDEAIAAYGGRWRWTNSATIPAELAGSSSRANRNAPRRLQPIGTQAGPANKQAHRVLGQLFAGLASSAQDTRAGRTCSRTASPGRSNTSKALETPVKQTDIDVRALLSRLYIAADQFDKAIPILTDIVKEAPSGATANLLMEAYSGAGKNKEAVSGSRRRRLTTLSYHPGGVLRAHGARVDTAGA